MTKKVGEKKREGDSGANRKKREEREFGRGREGGREKDEGGRRMRQSGKVEIG